MRRPLNLPERRQWSPGQRPPFVEAYPTFSVGEAHREIRCERDHLLWRDHQGLVAGAARCELRSRDELALSAQVGERSYLQPAREEIVLPLVWKGSGPDNARPFTCCPLCLRHVDLLVFVGTWCCASIHHGLRHRSAYLSRAVRWSEQLDELDREIAWEVEIGRSGRGHVRKCEDRDALLLRLGARRTGANALQAVVIRREWARSGPGA